MLVPFGDLFLISVYFNELQVSIMNKFINAKLFFTFFYLLEN